MKWYAIFVEETLSSYSNMDRIGAFQYIKDELIL
jgi:hypothetical protein